MPSAPRPQTKLRRLVRFIARWTFRITLLALLAGGAAAAYGWYWFRNEILTTIPRDLVEYRDWRPRSSVLVYDRNEALIDDFYVERRIWVRLDELPEHVWQAFVAAEDRRFFEHTGVDPQGILRAMWVNYQSGGSSQGASTLTQQLVKNLIVGNERSVQRKLREAVLATRLERELTKREILELYLNYVALGSGNYGVEAASQDYFGVSAREIDPGQAALLAGLVPAPSRNSPRSSPERAMRRREIALRSMVAAGYLDADDAATYLDDPVNVPPRGHPDDRLGVAYLTEVRREVRRLFGNEVPFDRGMRIVTPYDPRIQAVAEEAIRKALADHLERAGRTWRGGSSLGWRDWRGFLDRAPGLSRDADGKPVELEVGRCALALVLGDRRLDKLAIGPFSVALHPPDRWVKVRTDDPEFPADSLAKKVQAGDRFTVCRADDGSYHLPPATEWAEGATVVIENATGNVVALVGGKKDSLEGFVRATQGRRQPGSSFKPYVYAAALAAGKSQLDETVDAPIALPAGGGKVWAPQNYGGGFAGRVTLRTAISKSLNTVAVRLLLEVGSDQVAAMAHRAGVKSALRTDATLALGSSEVSPLDQVLGYSTFVNLGVRRDPVYIAELRDQDDEPLGFAGDTLESLAARPVTLPGGGERVLPRDVAWEISDMLSEVVRAGTGRRAYSPEQFRGGKTGTTNDFVDAWFVGFTRTHTVAVWVGTDGTHTLGMSETGGRSALPAWMTIVEALGRQPGDDRLPIPPEVVLLPYGGSWVGTGRGRAPRDALRTPPVSDAPLPPFGWLPAGGM